MLKYLLAGLVFGLLMTAYAGWLLGVYLRYVRNRRQYYLLHGNRKKERKQ